MSREESWVRAVIGIEKAVKKHFRAWVTLVCNVGALFHSSVRAWLRIFFPSIITCKPFIPLNMLDTWTIATDSNHLGTIYWLLGRDKLLSHGAQSPSTASQSLSEAFVIS